MPAAACFDGEAASRDRVPGYKAAGRATTSGQAERPLGSRLESRIARVIALVPLRTRRQLTASLRRLMREEGERRLEEVLSWLAGASAADQPLLNRDLPASRHLQVLLIIPPTRRLQALSLGDVEGEPLAADAAVAAAIAAASAGRWQQLPQAWAQLRELPGGQASDRELVAALLRLPTRQQLRGFVAVVQQLAQGFTVDKQQVLEALPRVAALPAEAVPPFVAAARAASGERFAGWSPLALVGGLRLADFLGPAKGQEAALAQLVMPSARAAVVDDAASQLGAGQSAGAAWAPALAALATVDDRGCAQVVRLLRDLWPSPGASKQRRAAVALFVDLAAPMRDKLADLLRLRPAACRRDVLAVAACQAAPAFAEPGRALVDCAWLLASTSCQQLAEAAAAATALAPAARPLLALEPIGEWPSHAAYLAGSGRAASVMSTPLFSLLGSAASVAERVQRARHCAAANYLDYQALRAARVRALLNDEEIAASRRRRVLRLVAESSPPAPDPALPIGPLAVGEAGRQLGVLFRRLAAVRAVGDGSWWQAMADVAAAEPALIRGEQVVYLQDHDGDQDRRVLAASVMGDEGGDASRMLLRALVRVHEDKVRAVADRPDDGAWVGPLCQRLSRLLPALVTVVRQGPAMD